MDKEYEELMNSYMRMFSEVDAFHFNSRNTFMVYEKFFNIPKASQIIPITHNGIMDKRRKRSYEKSLLRLGFIGSEEPYKGFSVLKSVVKKLNTEGYHDMLSLVVYGGRKGIDTNNSNIKYMGRYSYGMFDKVFDSMDLLIVPSICYETFSFITLEALSFGVPVLVSSTVGAKDIVCIYSPNFVYEGEQGLYDILLRILQHREILAQFNDKILSTPWCHTMMAHSKEIVERLYKK